MMTIQDAITLLGVNQAFAEARDRGSFSKAKEAAEENWKARALEEHPDLGGSVESMQRLNEAIELIRALRGPFGRCSGRWTEIVISVHSSIFDELRDARATWGICRS